MWNFLGCADCSLICVKTASHQPRQQENFVKTLVFGKPTRSNGVTRVVTGVSIPRKSAQFTLGSPHARNGDGPRIAANLSGADGTASNQLYHMLALITKSGDTHRERTDWRKQRGLRISITTWLAPLTCYLAFRLHFHLELSFRFRFCFAMVSFHCSLHTNSAESDCDFFFISFSFSISIANVFLTSTSHNC